MKQYWMNDVKKTERAIYIGHVTSEEVCHGIYEDKKNRLETLMKEVDMTGMRFSVLRDLGDEYPCAPRGLLRKRRMAHCEARVSEEKFRDN